MAKEREDVQGTCCMKNEEGNIMTDSEDIKAIWKQYMEKLLNIENQWDGEVECDKIQGPCCQVTEEEVSKALKRMAPGKAAGPTGVTS